MRNSRNGTKNDGKVKKALLLVISAVVAIALGLTCALFYGVNKPSSVDGVGGDGEVSESVTTLSNLTGNDIKTKVMAGQLKKNDVINYSYTGSNYWTGNIRSVVLPKGTYTLEVWGAQGGTGKAGSLVAGDVGGKGGYSKGTLTLTAETTIYIVIGGRGTDGYGSGNPIYYGGYNGGGTARGDCDSNGPAGSGGGATHIATASGLLSALNGNRNAVLIVGGGGGGGGSCSGAGLGGYGGGGNSNGGNADNRNGYAATGGTTNGTPTGGAGGAGSKPFSNNPGWGDGANTGVTTTYGTCIRGANGSFGRGGDGGGPTNDSGAGGGGGWFGGGGGAGRSGGEAWHSAAGGSGYIKSTLTKTAGTNGAREGHGYARITLVEVSQPPKTLNRVITQNAAGGAITRGTGLNIPVNASYIAEDPDGSPKTNVFFTNGAANADTLTTGNNVAALYLNEACTISASTYLDWTVNNINTITVTSVKKYPRASVGNNTSTADGDLVLYAKVRDAFGNVGESRIWSVIKFTLRVSPDQPTKRANCVLTDIGNAQYANQVFLGTSKALPAGGSMDEATAENLYSPNGGGNYTVLIKKPLQLLRSSGSTSNENDVKVTIKAKDLLDSVKQSAATGGEYDRVLIAINDTAKINPNDRNRVVKVAEYDANSVAVAYGPTGTRLANVFETVTLVGINARNDYQTLSATLYVVERASTRGTNYQYSKINTIPVQIVFKVDNTRPTLNADAINGKFAELETLKDTVINLNDYFADEDNPVIDASTHRIIDVKVPEYEFIQFNKYGTVLNTRNPDKTSYYNIVKKTPTAAELNKAYTETGTLGTGNETDFKPSYISTGASSDAYVRYSFSGATLTLTGLRATYDMYNAARTGYRPAISGNTSGVTQATDGTQANAGDFYILVNLQDLNDTNDQGIWLPIALRVKNSAPTATDVERGQQAQGSMPTAKGRATDVFYFTPMGITVDRKLNAIGKRKDADGNLVSDVNALAADADNFFYPSMTGNGKLNELVTLVPDANKKDYSYVQGGVANNDNGEYFSVETEKIYIPVSYFGGRLDINDYKGANGENLETVGGVDYVKIDGLKVTLNGWTHNRYFYAPVNVQDSAKLAGEQTTVYIAVYVENTTPNALDNTTGKKVAEIEYNVNGKKVASKYDANTHIVTYDVPVHSTVLITPYDVLTDLDMTRNGTVEYPAQGFTLNGLSGVYSETTKTFTVDGTANESDVKEHSIAGIATADNVKNSGYDYSSSAYRTALADTLADLGTTSSFGYDAMGKPDNKNCIAESNAFETPVAARDVGIDRLYFERPNDGDKLDGFTFNPYTGNYKLTDSFVRPVIVNDSYIKYWFGNELVMGDSYNLDFIVIEASQRTTAGAPVEITLNVRDRTGAGAFGDASGITKITVRINVINSTPYVSEENAKKVFTLATSPVYAADNSVYPSTLVISASALLTDNEGDPVSFYPNSWSVVDGEYTLVNGVKQWNNVTDEHGNRYEGKYVNVSLTSKEMTITALNSTQNIPHGLFVLFNATDGRSTNPNDVSQLLIQIEVLNAPISVDYGATGFEKLYYDEINPNNFYNMWTISSRNQSDKTASRYFASSAIAAGYLKDARYGVGASDAQVKTMITDTDGLQTAVLAPVVSPGAPFATRAYVNVIKDENGNVLDKINGNIVDYSYYVPYAKEPSQVGTNDPVGVLIGWIRPNGTGAVNTGDYINAFDILYFVDVDGDGSVEKYSASELRGANASVVNNNHEKFFDSEGRWIVSDWAVVISPKAAFASDTYLQLGVMARDSTEFGGDTAGIPTGYNGLRDIDSDQNVNPASRIKVDGFGYLQFQMFVKDTGIISMDYYDNFNGYYTVADGQNSGVSYISTYDGDSGSVYPSTLDSIYRNADNTITTGAGDSVIKQRGAGDRDFTDAGTNSGVEYSSSLTDGDAALVGAFRYSRTIEISGERKMENKVNTNYTYIPMSYFALKNDLTDAPAADGSYTYPDKSYIAYNVNSLVPYARGDITKIASAITISDGTQSWSGDKLFSNPYVNFTAYDAYEASVGGGSKLNTSNAGYAASLNQGYFNKCLAVTTVGDAGANGYIPAGISSSSANAQNLVGNGHLMYLAGQQQRLQENMFGIGISKKDTRASATNLTMTIAVAQCQYVDGVSGSPSGTTVYTSGDSANFNPSMYQARITLNLHIGNSPIKLENGVTAGEDGYHMDVSLINGESAWNVDLIRTGAAASGQPRTSTVTFGDEDIVTVNGAVDYERSDKAYFYTDSVKKHSAWTDGKTAYERVAQVTTPDNIKGKAVFKNTSSDAAAQASIAKYYGKNSGLTVEDLNSVKFDQSGNDVFGNYQPNGGIYGANNGVNGSGNDGYSGYFGVSFSETAQRVSISPLAKTVINRDAPGYPKFNTDTEVKKFYAERGLVVAATERGSDGVVYATRAYYPLRVLVYDDCGSGWGEGSYVSLEIRVFVEDAAPKLASNLENTTAVNNGNKSINISLAVGSEYRLNVADLITDSDLLANASKGEMYWKTTYDDLKNKPAGDRTAIENFALETRDYFKSPYTNWTASNNAALLSGNAGFSDGQSFRLTGAALDAAIAAMPDVVMYMDMGASIPSLVGNGNNTYIPFDNTIVIRVNRRTVYDRNGVAVSQNDFSFKITFTDSADNRSGTLTINLHVTNQAPTARTQGVKSTLKMRVGDTFTVMTTPADEFFAGTTSSNASYSVKNYDLRSRRNESMAAITEGLLSGYRALNSANLMRDEYRLTDYRRNDPTGKHLGYYAVATDDTPWSNRIENIHTNTNYLTGTPYDQIPLESDGSGPYALNYLITARNACVDMPLTIVIIDGDGGRLSYTMYITVESSVPKPIMYADENVSPINDGLYRVDDSTTPVLWGKGESKPAEFGTQQEGVFQLFMSAYAEGSKTDYKDVTLSGSGRKVRAFGRIQIDINKVAYDPDKLDNDTIALYDDAATPKFMFNDIAMATENDLRFTNDKLIVDVAEDGTSFTVTCLGFDVNEDYGELTFYVRDGGNNKLENALPITLRISTLYSALTNSNIYSTTTIQNGTVRITSADTVYVKPIDTYLGNGVNPSDDDYAKIGESSTYKFLKYAGMDESVDQDPAKSGARITDPDVEANTANLTYDVRIYALMNNTDGEISAMSLEDASKLFDINRNSGYFRLADKNDSEVSKYLIGGRNSTGGSYTASDREVLAYINKYFEFSVGSDGVSLDLQPITATDSAKPLLFYVETEKVVGSRSVRPDDSYPIAAGSIFYVEVKDSAPLANTYEDALKFKGKVGESAIFPIFDMSNPYASLFTDSDEGDFVSVKGFDPNSQSSADYDAALKDANCEWQGGKGTNKTQAISILVNNGDEPIKIKDGFNNNKEYEVPARSLMINVNRRIDVRAEDGSYLEEVELPVIITGVDKAGETSQVRLSLTICNSDFTVRESAIGSSFDKTGVGYELTRQSDYEFTLNAYVSNDYPALTLDVNRWLDDPDFTSVISDTESFRLVKNALDENKYLLDKTMDIVDSADGKTVIGTIEPKFTDNNPYKFEGIKVTADSYLRGHSGYAYMRVLDRSGDATKLDNGVTFTVNLIILNSAPRVLEGKEVIKASIVGSNASSTVVLDGDGKNLIDIHDIATDPNATDTPDKIGVEGNNTYLRIVSIRLLDPESINVVAEDGQDQIIVVEQVEDLQSLKITANKGAYGTQSVIVTVADGDINNPETLTTTFTVTITVIYNFDDIQNLKTLSTMRGMTTKVTVDSLIEEIPDSANQSGAESQSAIAPHADGAMFNPGAGYAVTGLSAKASDVNYVNISQDEEGTWQFRALRVTSSGEISLTAEFKLITELDNPNAQTYKREFNVSIADNPKPQLRPEFASDDGYTFYSSGTGSLVVNSDGNVLLSPNNVFTDNEGDIMTFVAASSNVPSLISATVLASDNLQIHFNAKGSAMITVTVADLTGESVTHTFKVVNIDLPDPSLWVSILVSFETNTMIWLIALGVLLLLIVFLIILIIVLKRRKRKREELEAMLVSEMELEEQIMRLSATPGISPYQSYGYLPPTMPVQNDPGLMLGGGSGNAPDPNAIGLNPGSAQTPPQGNGPNNSGNAG